MNDKSIVTGRSKGAPTNWISRYLDEVISDSKGGTVIIDFAKQPQCVRITTTHTTKRGGEYVVTKNGIGHNLVEAIRNYLSDE